MSNDDKDHHNGLEQDLKVLARLTGRRQILRWMAGASMVPLLGCGIGTDDPGDGNSACSKIPEETAGPFPGDGSNGANALILAGIIRGDIRSSIAGGSGVAAGVPLKVILTLVNSKNDCSPLAGHAIYLWHCDREGRYSMYSAGVTSENYLRGVQETDSNGQVTFTTIFPGCYPGRWPHMHFEIYPSLGVATASNQKIATSQLAFPEASCTEAYAASGYSTSVNNLKQLTLARDGVFSDGYASQLASVTGNATDGYIATLTVGIAR